jgi:hypothetical protein
MPMLRNVRQKEAVHAFCRLGAQEHPGWRGKGSHRVLTINGQNLVLPRGTLWVGFLKQLLKRSGVTEDDFIREL